MSFFEGLFDFHVDPVLKDLCRLAQGGMDRKPQSTHVGALNYEGVYMVLRQHIEAEVGMRALVLLHNNPPIIERNLELNRRNPLKQFVRETCFFDLARHLVLGSV